MGPPFNPEHALVRSVRVWLRRWPAWTAVALTCYLPDFALAFAPRFAAPLLDRTLRTLVSLVCGAAAGAAMTHAVIEELRGRPAPVAASVAVAAARILPNLLAGVLNGAAVVAAMLAFLVPALVVAPALFVAPAAAVVERLGPLRSLARSWTLTRGHRLGILGLVFLGIFMPLLLVGAVWALDVRHAAVTVAASALFAPFDGAATATTFYDLRRAKEGLDVEAAADAFA